MPPDRRLRAVVVCSLVWLAAHELRVLLGVDAGAVLFPLGSHVAVLGVATLVAGAAARRAAHGERLGWALIAAGIAGWGAGETYYVAVLWEDSSPPLPSPADAGFLLFPTLLVAGVALLLRVRAAEVPHTLRADGVAVGLAVSGRTATIVMPVVLEAASGRPLAVAVTLAYPLADLVLLGLIAGALAGMGWRADRRWMLLGAGVLLFWLADAFYAAGAVLGVYTAGGWFDAGW